MTEDPHGWDAFWRLYESGAWEPETRALIGTLQPGDLFVDVGAWIGPTTLWALEHGAEVIAIEPDPVASAELRRRVPDTVEVWQGAIGTETGHAFLATNPREGGALGDSMSRLGADGVAVRTWTLADVLGGRRPALVKVDVEGYEMELCPTLLPWLAECGATTHVSFHGGSPDPSWVAGFADVRWPDSPNGDLVARP